MENTVAIELLNGMPLTIFWKWFIIAMAGAFVYLITRIIIILGPEKVTKVKTPQWSWRRFLSGFLKLLVTLIVAPWVILYFDVVAPTIFEFIFDMGSTNATGSAHQHITMELNGLSAFGLGFSIDFMTHKAIKKYYKNGK